MKLYYNPISPFARKVMICAHENGLLERIQLVGIDSTDEVLRRVNPLSKLPTLELGDGSGLYDSRVICEYLDGIGRGAMIPDSGHDRLRARLLEALGDGIADATLRWSMEIRRPEHDRHADVIARQLLAMRAGVAEAERLVDAERFTLGEAALAAALTYIDLRAPLGDWRAAHPDLAAWFARAEQRPSLTGTAPVSAS
jgi:glutathione S-transferase